MTDPISLVQRARLEKVAQDNGFDISEGEQEAWLKFSSTQVPLTLWLGVGESAWFAAFSQAAVAEELASMTAVTAAALRPPSGAVSVRQVDELTSLHLVVRRAYQLSATLPDELFREFERQAGGIQETTEVERLTVQRIGQGVFRTGLMRYWDGRCAVTGLTSPELLRASHIKPWSRCETARERLNVFNGLLLAVHLDAAFDSGFISFNDDGGLMISRSLDRSDGLRLGLTSEMRLCRLEIGHREALNWHRTNIFRNRAQP